MQQKIKAIINISNNLYSQNEIQKSILLNELIYVKGLVGSGKSYRIASLYKNLNLNFFIILNNSEEASYYLNDFENFLPNDEVLFFPSSFDISKSSKLSIKTDSHPHFSLNS